MNRTKQQTQTIDRILSGGWSAGRWVADANGVTRPVTEHSPRDGSCESDFFVTDPDDYED